MTTSREHQEPKPPKSLTLLTETIDPAEAVSALAKKDAGDIKRTVIVGQMVLTRAMIRTNLALLAATCFCCYLIGRDPTYPMIAVEAMTLFFYELTCAHIRRIAGNLANSPSIPILPPTPAGSPPDSSCSPSSRAQLYQSKMTDDERARLVEENRNKGVKDQIARMIKAQGWEEPK